MNWLETWRPLNSRNNEIKKEMNRTKKIIRCYTLQKEAYVKRMKRQHALPKRFLKIMRSNSGIPWTGNSSRYNKNNEFWHKCGKPRNFIKYYPQHKLEYKEYVKTASEREKKKDLVTEKFSKRAATYNVVKQALAAWKDSSSESN